MIGDGRMREPKEILINGANQAQSKAIIKMNEVKEKIGLKI